MENLLLINRVQFTKINIGYRNLVEIFRIVYIQTFETFGD